MEDNISNNQTLGYKTNQILGSNPRARKFIGLFMVTVLVLTITITVAMIRQRQDIRKKAFGTGPISVNISSASGSSFSPGAIFTASVNLINTSTTTRNIYTAGMVLQFDPGVLSISNVTCNSQTLPLSVKNSVVANNLILTCAKSGGGGSLALNPGSAIAMASFQVTVNPNAAAGTTTFSLSTLVIPDGGANLADISSNSGPFNFTIAGSSPTPTPSGSSPTFSRTEGTSERLVHYYYCTSWGEGCRQMIPMVSYNGNLSRIELELRATGNAQVRARIYKLSGTTATAVSPEVTATANGTVKNWISFNFNPPVGIAANTIYYVYLKKVGTTDANPNVYWLTYAPATGANETNTMHNYKVWLATGGTVSPTPTKVITPTPTYSYALTPTPTRIPTLVPTRTPTPTYGVLPTPTRTLTPTMKLPTATPTTSQGTVISEIRGNTWITASTYYTTSCGGVAGFAKANLPLMKVTKVNLYLKWTTGGGTVSMVLQNDATKTNVSYSDKTVTLPSTASSGSWVTFDYSSAPVSLPSSGAYRIFLKKAGTAPVFWLSSSTSCDYVRNYQVFLVP